MKAFKPFKSIVMLLTLAALSLVLGVSINLLTNLDPLKVASGVFALPFAVKTVSWMLNRPFAPSGVLSMAIQQELWVEYIIENLFKDNEFLTQCHDESSSVLAGAVVHIPQAGAVPTVVKNRSSFPGTAVQRTDTDITYALNVLSTDPTHITDAEQHEISYDKIGSVIGEHVSALGDAAADEILYSWAPTSATYILRTSGTADALALAPGATGTRKALKKEDLQAAQTLMNKNKVPKKDRIALVPSDMLTQLLNDADLKARDGVHGNEADLKEGVVMRLYGFKIMERSDTTVYTEASPPVPKAPGAATAVTDNQAVICWQKDQVTKALGDVKFFENIKDALYYGDVYSAQVKLGGRKRRSSGLGVVAIVQTT